LITTDRTDRLHEYIGGFIGLHVETLANLGLNPIPRWGGGHALPGTNHRSLADNPPTSGEIMESDYSGGLAILTGTAHLTGGYVLGVDIDEGPQTLPGLPRGFLYAETGTAPGKWHLFIRATDRLDGQLNLITPSGQLVAEVKGYGQALRSWPTVPPDKPRGYTPLASATNVEADTSTPVPCAVGWREGCFPTSSYLEVNDASPVQS
jgi:hypothetical protein